MPEFVAIKRDVIAGYFGRTHRAYIPVHQYITFLPQTNTFVYLSFVLMHFHLSLCLPFYICYYYLGIGTALSLKQTLFVFLSFVLLTYLSLCPFDWSHF